MLLQFFPGQFLQENGEELKSSYQDDKAKAVDAFYEQSGFWLGSGLFGDADSRSL
jgi:hypothetical protein